MNDQPTRRQVLRGLGACITLPTLMSAGPAFAKADRRVPTRMAYVYVPNGAIPGSWWPAGEAGTDFDLSEGAGVMSCTAFLSGLSPVLSFMALSPDLSLVTTAIVISYL